MKNGLMFILGTIFTITGFSQDIIYKKDGTQISAKVSEISSSHIKYKKFTNPTGPIYELIKTDVLKIVYPDGSVDDFSREAESAAQSGVENIKQLMKANANAGHVSNGKVIYKLNDKDYSTEFNSLQVTEIDRQASLVFKNRSAIAMMFTSTVVADSKKIVLFFTLTQNDMKPGTFKANSSNELEQVNRQFAVSVSYINPNMNGGFGGGNNIPINNIKTGRFIIETIDKENRTISGSFQVIGTAVDGGKIDLQGTFNKISY